MQQETKNLVAAIAISAVAIIGFNTFFGKSSSEKKSEQVQESVQKAREIDLAKKIDPISRENALSTSTERIKIETDSLSGSISLKGALFDDITLAKYSESVEKPESKVVLLSPQKTESPYFVSFGWKSTDTDVPTDETEWKTDGKTLTPETPITLSWRNNAGIEFEQMISIDRDYMINVKQSVKNAGNKTVSIRTTGLINRIGTPKTAGMFVLHEGPVGVFEGKLKEIKYEKLTEDQAYDLGADKKGTGWIGITDKYWLVSLVPDISQTAKGKFSMFKCNDTSEYHAESISSYAKLAPGDKSTSSTNLFIGAKQLALLDKYEASLRINHFDLAVDFGWFYFITKPMFYFISLLKSICGNFGIAIILMTLAIKALFIPLSVKSYRSMALMKKVQPKIDAIKELYKDDKQRLNQELMGLYKKEKVNPAAGLLPMIIQIPVFFALYKVLFISIEMRQAEFFWWVHDLSIADTSNLFTMFGLISWDPPSFLRMGAWPLIMGGSMLLQQRLTSNPTMMTDPVQKIMFSYIMPCMFTYMLSQFPVGLVIYWTCNNLFTMMQQIFITKYYESRVEPQTEKKWKK